MAWMEHGLQISLKRFALSMEDKMAAWCSPLTAVVTRWYPNKHRERTESEWLVLGLGWG